MNLERMRDFLLTLPHVLEKEQFGGLVYWVGDKAIGGKMFAMMNPDTTDDPISWPAGVERFAELVEQEGFRPAPYLARAFWVTVERWDVLRSAEWSEELTAAHTRTLAKLPPKTHAILALPAAEQRRVTTAACKALAAKTAAAKAAKAAVRAKR